MASRQLTIVTSATGSQGDGGLLLDKKFAVGMAHYAASWDGPVRCMVPASVRAQPFAGMFQPRDLSFDVQLFDPAKDDLASALTGTDIAMICGDNAGYLPLSESCARRGITTVFTIEYTLKTRLQINGLDRSRSALRKMRSALWLMSAERRRRAAFRQAAGLQANGYPAFQAFRGVNDNTICYLDNRMEDGICATPDDQRNRHRHLTGGGPLRLLHSGRLETMKGSQDLVPIARALRDRKVDFHLTIFGTGSLERSIREDIARHDLAGRVTLNPPVDFNTELVPFARLHADAFLSCHRQSDPSCSYLENMACGLPVFGYANDMWDALKRESGAGWAVPIGHTRAMADMIAKMDKARGEMVQASDRALDFARQHSFEHEFQARVDHLRQLADHR